jgi:hypothetical protein
MKRTLLTLAAGSAILAGAVLMPAHAMSVGTAFGMKAAAADTAAVEDIAYVCRHRYYSSRRVCWWTPSRPWRHRYWRSRRW